MNTAPSLRSIVADRLESWVALRRRTAALLRHHPFDAECLAQIESECDALNALQTEDVDLALYTLLWGASHDLTGYSAAHAMTCAVICDIAAQHLAFTVEERRSLALAALTMNLSITSLQDTLSEQLTSPSQEQRDRLSDHGAASARLLASAGVADPLWLDVVASHHHVNEHPTDPCNRSQVMTELLRRVDIYTAKLSRRATRAPTTPLHAAREACLDASGHPDAIGAAMLRVIGLYPPGTWVVLASDELALITRTGAKAHTPMASAVRRLDGSMLYSPALRDTSDPAFQVRKSMDGRDVRVRLDHVRVLTA